MEYVVQKYSLVYINMGKIKKEFRKTANISDEFTTFTEFVTRLTKELHNALVIDQVGIIIDNRSPFF